jgi:4-hydroxy 2-oxovalerate aldolase
MDDVAVCEKLKAELSGKQIVLIAPGKKSVDCKDTIMEYIRSHNSAVMAVNALLSDYDYDYAFFVNPSRYDYASKAQPEKFSLMKRVILSNINGFNTEKEYKVAYDHVIMHGWKYFDNAVICCLRLLDYLGIDGIAIAGFDGFKNVYNESYADPGLPSLNVGVEWEPLNEEIKAMFKAFKEEATTCRSITFLTDSYFNDGGVLRS